MFARTTKTPRGTGNTIAIAVVLFVFLFSAFAAIPNTYAQEESLEQNPADAQTGTVNPTQNAVSAAGIQGTNLQQQLSGVDGFLYSIFLGFGTFILTLAGALFDYAIGLLVIGMGSFVNTGGIGTAINNLWVVIRDMFNILFIFGLIYLGLKTIWNASDSNTRRSLGMIIAAALLINFSLYTTQAVVDFTNVAATQIYNLMEAPGGARAPFIGEVKGISSGFMQAADLETYAQSSQLLQKDAEDSGNLPSARILAYGLMMMIFMLIAAFVFAAGAILIVIRFVLLVLFMIASPLLFIGWIIPRLSGVANEWGRKFLNQALFAPAFLFMLYLSLTVLTELQTTGSFASALTSPGTGGGLLQIVLYFAVIITFMIASLVVSQKMGAMGANQSIKLGKSAARRGRVYAGRAAGRAAKGAGGFAGRNVVGRASNALLKSYDAAEARAKDSKFAKGTRAAANVMSLGALSDRNVRGVLQKGRDSKYGGSVSFTDDQKYAQEKRKRQSADAAAQQRESAIKAGINATTGENAQKVDPQVMKDFADAMKNLTDKQLTEDLKLGTLENKNVAIHLNEKQLETLQKSGQYSDAELGQIKKARSDGFKEIAQQSTESGSAYNPTRTPEWLAQKGDDEMAKMPIEVYISKNMAPHLTPGAVETKLKSGGVGEDMREQIRQNINQVIAEDLENKTYNGRYANQWQKWSDRSPIGAHLGLSFDTGYPEEEEFTSL